MLYYIILYYIILYYIILYYIIVYGRRQSFDILQLDDEFLHSVAQTLDRRPRMIMIHIYIYIYVHI